MKKAARFLISLGNAVRNKLPFHRHRHAAVQHIISIRHDGLGGRLVCLMNALALSRSLGSQLSVVWPVNRHCASQFDDLFGQTPDIALYAKREETLEPETSNIGYLGKHQNCICRTVEEVDHLVRKDHSRERRLTRRECQQEYTQILNTCKIVLIRTVKPLPFDTGLNAPVNFFEHLTLTPSLQKKNKRIC